MDDYQKAKMVLYVLAQRWEFASKYENGFINEHIESKTKIVIDFLIKNKSLIEDKIKIDKRLNNIVSYRQFYNPSIFLIDIYCGIIINQKIPKANSYNKLIKLLRRFININ